MQSKMEVPPCPSLRKRRQQPWPIRLTHWFNVLFVILLAGSGLQILAAYPALGPRGALYRWYPFQGIAPPQALQLGGWLAGGRHWHFAIAWLFVINGAIYLAYFWGSGEWHRRLFLIRRDGRTTLWQLAFYLRLSKSPPPPDFYDGLQRLAYSGVIALAAVMVLSGLAIYKPVQLHFLTILFGGYDGARAVHLAGLGLIALFAVLHLVLVLSHPRELVKMVTGGQRE
jgi:thiosulfate reductase cytochrome b subunit